MQLRTQKEDILKEPTAEMTPVSSACSELIPLCLTNAVNRQGVAEETLGL